MLRCWSVLLVTLLPGLSACKGNLSVSRLQGDADSAQSKTSPKPATRYLEAALKTARWLDSTAVERGGGRGWPTDPKQPERFSDNLYNGGSGVILFSLQAYATTGDAEHRERAEAGARYLISNLPRTTAKNADPGLYTGTAGIAFALHQTYKITNDRKFLDAARTCVRSLLKRANKTGAGVQWNSSTDIISGSAGVGLLLLYAATEMDMPECEAVAAACGRRLMEISKVAKEGGRKWPMRPGYARWMPNFSHGTAGVSYYLAALHEKTKDKTFKKAAVEGARYLEAVGGEQCLVFHNQPGGEKLFYLGWCHGPAGTARLFYKLYTITGDKRWLEFVKTSAKSLMESGIPDKQTPGFWNNVGMCCGSAGVGDFFLDLHSALGDADYLAFARRMADNLLSRATVDYLGMRWVQAEHRVRPDLLQAQTGWAQGASGVGLFLIKLDAVERGRPVRIILPDTPFRSQWIK